MPTVAELLNDSYVEGEQKFLIDKLTREVTVPENWQLAGVESDDTSHMITFKVDNVMTSGLKINQANSIRVNYVNANEHVDADVCSTVRVSGDTAEFDWIISRKAVVAEGQLSFVVCVRWMSGSVVQHEWNSKICTLDVAKGIEVTLTPEQEAQAQSLIDQLIAKQNTVVSEITAEATTQKNRVTAEGNTQDARVVTEGDTQVARVSELIDMKANKDGYYPDMEVGAADNLIGRGAAVGAEFTKRITGGSASIGDGEATIESIHGHTVVWNRTLRYRGTITEHGLTITNNGDNIKITGTCSEEIQYNQFYVSQYNEPGNPFKRDGTKYAFVINKNISWGLNGFSSHTGSFIWSVTGGEDWSGQIYVTVLKDEVVNITGLKFLVCNLTKMFGKGNEPTTIEEFEALFPRFDYPYSTGTLLNFNATGIKTVGKNLLDFRNAKGGTIGGITCTILDDNSYRYSGTGAGTVNVWFLGNYAVTEPVLFTLQKGVRYLVKGCTLFSDRTETHSSFYGSFYTPTKDFNVTGVRCPNVDGTVDGVAYPIVCVADSIGVNTTYEPYWENTHPIHVKQYFPEGMKSAGTVYDELTKDKAIKRIGSVDLGTLTWFYDSNVGHERFVSQGIRSLIKYPSSNNKVANIICDKYVSLSANKTYEKVKGISIQNNGDVYVCDDDYTNATAFKQAMQGVMLYYELATPVETPIDPMISLSYPCDNLGTEEIVTKNDELSTPFNGLIVYGKDYAEAIENLPKTFISKESMDNFCASIGAYFGCTITATWDEYSQRYTYAITEATSGKRRVPTDATKTVDLTSYTSAANAYEAPVDGYLWFGAPANTTVKIAIDGNTMISAVNGQHNATFVVKGAKMYITTGTPSFAKFSPLEHVS